MHVKYWNLEFAYTIWTKIFERKSFPSQLAAESILFQEKCIRVFKTLKVIDFY